jgi:hypothetical protein
MRPGIIRDLTKRGLNTPSGDPICLAVRDEYSGIYFVDGILASVSQSSAMQTSEEDLHGRSDLVELKVQGTFMLMVGSRTFQQAPVRIFASVHDIAPAIQHTKGICEAGMDLEIFGLQ